MRLRGLVWSAFISAAMAGSVVPAVGAAMQECTSGKPTAASYTWDFQGEANTILRDVQADAQQALAHAATLQSFESDPDLSWETHATQLEDLKGEINDIGGKLCRLETIRRVVAPWQQHAIDQIAMNVRLMADNAQDAISFVNDKPNRLWLATYQGYLSNLYNEAENLTNSVGNAVEFSSVSKEYRDLGRKLGARASS